MYVLSLDVSYYEKEGYTGEKPTDLEVEFEGFTVLYHEPDFIAADGSTEFKIYYDRNYYLINFELDGGHGVEPVYGKYQSVYNIPEPTKKGYVFEGWVRANENGDFIDDNGNLLTDEQARAAARKFTSGTVPAHNEHYKAYWSAGKSLYSIIYWIENADDTEFTDVASEDMYTYVDGTDIITGQTVNIGDLNEVPDFFSFNLKPQKVLKQNGKVVLDENLRPIYLTNAAGKPIDEDGNVIDFPEMSPGEREELNGKQRYFEIDMDKSDMSVEVSGDGTTRINVYYKRREITQRFFFARKLDSGKYQIPGYTKAFSTKDGTLDQHLSNQWQGRTDWMELSDDRPQISAQHADELEVKEYYSAPNQATYYYFELKTEYYSNMRDNWLEDAFDPLLITKNNRSEGENDCALFGAWSVEWGTPYAKKSNKTVKGIYEILDEQLLYTEDYLTKGYVDDPLVLNYLSFWANAKNQDWNMKDTFYNFTYKNYVELLPKEVTAYTLRNDMGDYVEIYHDEATNKYYGLLPENIIETYDGGDQYLDPATRDEKIKDNQTASALTGFALLTKEEIDASSLTQNPMCSWYAKNGFNADHHADVKYFYRRRYYSLVFMNNNVKEPPEKTRNIYYQMDINSVGIRGNWVYFEPEYPDENMRDYYIFDGWYFDEDHTEKIETIENDPAYGGRTHFNSDFKMPSDDITVYAKWVLVKENVSFYHDYGAMTSGAEPVHSCEVYFNDLILTADVPTTEQTPTAPYLETPPNSEFAGWYYLNQTGQAVRFDPESMPVTHELKLYAAWSSEEPAQYTVTYVEKGTNIEVAPPTTGTAFVHQTKSFNAKVGDQLNEAHQTTGENMWRPTTPSHSIYIEENGDNSYAFEYIQKPEVWYRVCYLDAQTNAELHSPKEASTPLAVVTEPSVYIQGYIADSVSKYASLAASASEDPETAKLEELAANTIIFYYTKNDHDTLYRTDHYIMNTDGTGYELYRQDTTTAELHSTVNLTDVFNNSETAQSLIASGYEFEQNKTEVNGAVATSQTYTLDEDGLIISFFYERKKYAYTVQYVDYDDDTVLQTNIYNSPEQLEPVGKTITINPDGHFTYNPPGGGDPVTYTRISDRTLTMLIHPDNNENPAVNVIKVYYKKNRQIELRFVAICDRETTDRFGDVSDSLQIVEEQEDIRPVTAILHTLDDHVYTFIGWYNVPNPGESDQPLTTDYAFTPVLPGADMTYYAVFRQEQVVMNAEIMYNDTGVYDSTAQTDADGSVTGHIISFENPEGYTSGAETPMNKQQNFKVKASPKDDGICFYEFAGWYYENESSQIVPAEASTSEIELPMTDSYHYIAMFKKVNQIPCKLVFRFIPRIPNADTMDDGYNEYVVKKMITSDKFAECIERGSEGLELTNEFILSEAPYESNHAQTLSWSDRSIVKSSDNGTLCATVTADQQAEKATVTYCLEPGGAYSAFQTPIGSNREDDPQIEALDVRGKTFGGKYFTYWEIKNDRDELVARCYEPWFTFRIWENYTVTPVFNSDADTAPVLPSTTTIELIKLDDSRNRWTDSEGVMRESARSDYLYTDFEVAFDGPDIYNDPTYRAGMVFEVCAKYENAPDPEQWNYATDEDNLKEAVRTKSSGNTSYIYDPDAGKSRTIQINQISTSDLSTRSRAQYGKAFRNVISANTGLPTNGNYVFKVYAFLVKDDQVTLSNPVYVCLHDIAVRDLMVTQEEIP